MFNNGANLNFNYAHGGNETPRRDNPCGCPQEYAQITNDTSNCVGWGLAPTANSAQCKNEISNPVGNAVLGVPKIHAQNVLTSADIISLLPAYELYLIEGERSANTVSKYLRDIRAFAEWQGENAHGENGISNRVGVAAPCDPPNPAQGENDISNPVGNAVLGVPTKYEQIINKPRVGTGSDGAVPLCRVATFPPHCGGIFPACPPNTAQISNETPNPVGAIHESHAEISSNSTAGASPRPTEMIYSSPLTKSHIIAYKNHLISLYAVASVNSILCSLNSFFGFAGRGDLCVKQVKIQRRIFCDEQKELTQKELSRLLRASVGKQVYYIICTLTLTGIRIGELKYITAGAVENGCAVVNNKGKVRRIYIPKKLQSILREYMKRRRVKTGSVFVTRNGKPVDRSNVWRMMKKLCKKAEVNEEKVFPHNLRHLFARAFYGESKDITRLADILGHSNVNTTRIYTRESGKQHRKTLDLLCRMIF